MKVCKYCGTPNDNESTKCQACGAADFSYKCGNCGTVFNSSFCPTCGTKAGLDAMKCPDCGTRYYSAACPNCGYSAARKAASRDIRSIQNASNSRPISATTIQPSLNEATPKKKGTFWKVLLWIFFFPIMATIAIWKSKMHIAWKIVLTVLLFGFFAYSSANRSSADADTVANPTSGVKQIASASNSPSSSATISPVPAPSPTPIFSVAYDVGQYKVGLDIAAGEYVAVATNGFGYICVSADANQADITFNEVFETNTVFTVYDGEYLELSGCTAVLADEFYTAYTIGKDKDGVMLKVGHDIPAGEYKLESTNGMGYYSIYNDTRHTKIVANDVFETTSFVTVKDGQYLVLSGCKIVD